MKLRLKDPPVAAQLQVGLALLYAVGQLAVIFLFMWSLVFVESASAQTPNFDLPVYKAPTNPFDQSGPDWYECTRYAWGRAAEVTGIQLQFTVSSGRDGGTWYWYVNDMPRGKEPRANAIAEWSNNVAGQAGHVGYVEGVDGDNVTLSDANRQLEGEYDGTRVLTRQEVMNRPGYTFNGYIYVGGTPPPAKFKLGDRVEANSTINVRDTAGGNSVGQHFIGDTGTIVGGMVGATYGSPLKYYQCWNVNWDSGVDGWSIEDGLSQALFATTLTSGQTVNGTIATPTQVDRYEVNLTNGEPFWLVATKTSGGITPYIALYHSDGSLYKNASGNPAAISGTATNTDSCYVLIRDYYSASAGNYSITLTKVLGPQAPDVDSGELTSQATHSGSISPFGEIDLYTINLNGGEPFWVVATTSGGITPYITLYHSDGSFYKDNAGNPAVISGAAPMTDTYYVVIRDYYWSGAGNYSITLTKVLGPQPPDVDSGELTSQATHSGSISPFGEIDLYTITLNGGEPYWVVATTSGGITPYITLYHSDGSFYKDNAGNPAVVSGTTPMTDTYYVVVRDYYWSGAGNYSITLTKVLGPQAPDVDSAQLTSGAARSAMISPFGEIDLYTINLDGGQPFWVVATTSGGITPYIALYHSDGSFYKDAAGNPAVVSGTTPMTDTYYVLIRDYYWSGAGNYFLSFGQLSSATGTAAIAGNMVNIMSAVGLGGGVVQAWRSNGGTNILQAIGTTDGNGNYNLGNLPAGTYELRVFHSGYLSQTNSAIVATSAQTVTVGTFRLYPAPDLVISGSVDVSPNPVTAGTNLTVSYTVLNQGAHASADSQTLIQIKLATNTVAVVETNHITPGLITSGTERENVTLFIPGSFPPGAYTVYVTLDCNNALGQSEIDNDIMQTPDGALSIVGPPQPTIASLSPSPVIGASSRQTITINGTNFVNKPTLTLTWTGQPGYPVPDAQVTFVSSTQLRMSITTTTTPDSWTVSVTNPDGQSSVPFQFPVLAAPTGPEFYGVDVSSFGQPSAVNWSQVHQATITAGGQAYPVTFVLLRASKGKAQSAGDCEFIDPDFAVRAQAAAAAGILVGAYHVASVTNSQTLEFYQAADEAAFFVSVAGSYITGGNLRPALDLEDNSCGSPKALGKSTLSAWVDQWLTTVRQLTGVTPIIYCNQDYLEVLDATLAQKYDLWIANPTGDPDSPANLTPWTSRVLQQYDWHGSVSGMPDQVDLDVFHGVLQEFMSALVMPPVRLGGNLQPPSNGEFQFAIAAPGLQQIILQASDDLINWTDLSPVPLTAGQGIFTDSTVGAHVARFYRAKP